MPQMCCHVNELENKVVNLHNRTQTLVYTLIPYPNINSDPQVGRHVEELEDVRLVVLDGQLILQFVGMMRRFDAAGEPIPLRLEGRQWLARLERVRPQVRGA